MKHYICNSKYSVENISKCVKLTKNQVLFEFKEYLFLLLIVFVGGQVGNFINLKIFSTKTLALITSILVIIVAIRMGFNILNI